MLKGNGGEVLGYSARVNRSSRDEKDESVDDEISKLVEERQQARAEKNFQRADEIRDMLKERGITLKDTPQGVQIIKAE